MDLTGKYCCTDKCFEIPRSQVDGLACTRCNSYCFCVCACKIANAKLQKFTDKILNKAKQLSENNSGLIGIKIYKGKGYVATHCRYFDEYVDDNDIYNNFYLYDENQTIIPKLSIRETRYNIVEKTYKSIVYIIDIN